MYHIISKLIMYGNMDQDSILVQLAKLIDNTTLSNDELVSSIYTQLKRLLELATKYGFYGHLWHNYLTFILITNENSFSITCEKQDAKDGSVNKFALNDFKVFKQLFD